MNNVEILREEVLLRFKFFWSYRNGDWKLFLNFNGVKTTAYAKDMYMYESPQYISLCVQMCVLSNTLVRTAVTRNRDELRRVAVTCVPR